MKVCVECKHFKGADNAYMAQMQPQSQEAECGHPDAASRDPIYGKAFCRNERNDRKGCGSQGKLWESKNEKKN